MPSKTSGAGGTDKDRKIPLHERNFDYSLKLTLKGPK